ncbi:NAD-dependent epimerase/dehydratase family protein [Nonomuraea sp. NPDC052116]|uniref:NAD-dependent epimerase/dehydratase family protein n=1 Tax=Nonomuraea sp. NPDC052116 TaxID=3155665 RepID=UPI00342FDD5B
MNVLITGGTGYIGSSVLQVLRSRGHRVRAVVRSGESAKTAIDAGAEAVVGDMADVAWLTGQVRGVDSVIHLATLGPEGDDSVITAVLAAFEGTDKPFVYTGGIWTWGDNPDIREETDQRSIALTAWRVERQRRVLESGLKASVVSPSVVYGHGKGIPAEMFTHGPRTEDGALRLIGSGEQHWSTVHVDDLAELYVDVLERAPGGELYIATSGVNPTVREMAQAAVGPEGTLAPESADETRARLGELLADALLLDQQAQGTRAMQQFGWSPSRPTVLEELAAN